MQQPQPTSQQPTIEQISVYQQQQLCQNVAGWSDQLIFQTAQMEARGIHLSHDVRTFLYETFADLAAKFLD